MVTTPQGRAAEVAERAGTMASMMHQRVVGVVENMSYLAALRPRARTTGLRSSAPAAASGSPRRSASGSATTCPCSARCRWTCTLREGGDTGTPIVESHPTSAAAVVLQSIADSLAGRNRGLAGMQLGLTPPAGW